jgi:hypothetical protein
MTNTLKGCPLLTLNLLPQINALHDWRQTNVRVCEKRDRDDEYPEGLPAANPKSAAADKCPA